MELPVPDELGAWSAQGQEEVNSDGLPNRLQPTLKELYQAFLEDGTSSQRLEMSHLQLSLLLQPLQCLVQEYAQLASLVHRTPCTRRSTSASISSAMLGVQEEMIGSLLRRWYWLAEGLDHLPGEPLDPVIRDAMIRYHLVVLNTLLAFPEVEKLCRERQDNSQVPDWLQQQSIADGRRIAFHCGQTLRLVQATPKSQWPAFFSGAAYRVALILAIQAFAPSNASQRDITISVPGEHLIMLDALHPADSRIEGYLRSGRGIPALTGGRTGHIEISDGSRILSFSAQMISEALPRPVADGIASKLEHLSRQLFVTVAG